jgi:hypothetical protein
MFAIGLSPDGLNLFAITHNNQTQNINLIIYNLASQYSSTTSLGSSAYGFSILLSNVVTAPGGFSASGMLPQGATIWWMKPIAVAGGTPAVAHASAAEKSTIVKSE